MNKTDLIEKVAKDADLSKAAAGRAVNAVFEGISDSLSKGEEVGIVGFGTFSVSERPARQGRNPQTGKPIQIAATKVPKFKAGKNLKDSVK
ncbi:DNA-binding protein HU [Thiohalorhabdus denitrificans]|uniref:DNA-binding protein HU-beta n=2 Tax=Thiohalorhabdus TaxID=492233 RepID=A0A0P9C7G6_9GAMM|nr:HU family DNA-binding protein [Thiohalorhabdus denitrificans]KPV39159.1 DNA-binding protein HU [Thiohalorhabdus denitrificans]SCX76108.1 DNA-binding protein HU-beta [Thiohalorhabdus denitrificans]